MSQIDFFIENQGRDKDERIFGYAGIEGRGGYFFAWHPTLEETLASIEPDEIDPPQHFSDRARQEIRGLIRREFAAQRGRHDSLIPAAP